MCPREPKCSDKARGLCVTKKSAERPLVSLSPWNVLLQKEGMGVVKAKSLQAVSISLISSVWEWKPLAFVQSFTVYMEKGMATHSSILAWRIPWTEEPGGLQSMGLQRVRHDWVTFTPHSQFTKGFAVYYFISVSIRLMKSCVSDSLKELQCT